jgi:hypothetical protein
MRSGPRSTASLALSAALLVLAHAPAADAQNALHAAIAAQPKIYEDAGAPRGCGLRLFAAHIASDLWIVAVETTIDAYADGTAAFKGGVFEFAAPGPGRQASPSPVAIEAVWLKSPDMDATQPVLDKIDKGPGGYALRYAINSDSAIGAMLAAMKGESMLFGFKRADNRAEPIFAGTAKLTRGEMDQLKRCLANLAR